MAYINGNDNSCLQSRTYIIYIMSIPERIDVDRLLAAVQNNAIGEIQSS